MDYGQAPQEQQPPLPHSQNDLVAKASNPIIRFAPIALGVLIAILASGLSTWKSASEQSARAKVDSIKLKIEKLDEKLRKTDDSDKEDRYEEQLKDLRYVTLPDAKENAAEESIDALSGVFIIRMAQWFGLSLIVFGFVLVALIGSPHERLGSLVGLAFLLLHLLKLFA
ncbi:hypothetical protein N9142_04440 [Akkermansiaceae bacterium]|nr:hypothetical protein [bacterium]MDB4434368.1 hypothetical protein [Akkermansiaceae bacterium]